MTRQVGLLLILAISTLLCVVNAIFYARLWWHRKTWGAGLLAAFPWLFLASRLMEIQKLVAEWMGTSYASSPDARIGIGLIGILLCGAQTTAMFVRFGPYLRDEKRTRRANDREMGSEDRR